MEHFFLISRNFNRMSVGDKIPLYVHLHTVLIKYSLCIQYSYTQVSQVAFALTPTAMISYSPAIFYDNTTY
jgi:hypothetical protein